MTALSKDFPVPSAARLQADVEALARLTRPDRPYTRRAFSDEDRAARAWLAERMAEAGLEVRLDAAANVIGRRPGRPAGPPLVIGSHLDTVEAGGRFDGIAGVLAGLEVARCLHCPEEWAEADHLAAGTRVLLELILRLDAELEKS